MSTKPRTSDATDQSILRTTPERTIEQPTPSSSAEKATVTQRPESAPPAYTELSTPSTTKERPTLSNRAIQSAPLPPTDTEQPTPPITSEHTIASRATAQTARLNTSDRSTLPPAKRPHRAPEAPPVPKPADAPFNSDRADVILRSSDYVDFRVRKGVLAAASTFFDDMFMLPPLPVDRKRKDRDDGDEYVGDVPIIPVTEDSRTLDTLLRFCYPCRDPKISNPILACLVFDATHKYMMDEVGERVDEQMQVMMKRNPFEFYAVSSVRGWKKEMEEAARITLSLSSIDDAHVPALDALNYGHVQRLRRYHRACSNAAIRLIGHNHNFLMLPWLQDADTVSLSCTHPKARPANVNPSKPRVEHYFKIYGGTMQIVAPIWLFDGVLKMREAIKVRPRGKSVLDPDIIDETVQAGMAHCSECAPRVSWFVKNLAKTIGKEVEKEVAKIQISSV